MTTENLNNKIKEEENETLGLNPEADAENGDTLTPNDPDLNEGLNPEAAEGGEESESPLDMGNENFTTQEEAPSPAEFEGNDDGNNLNPEMEEVQPQEKMFTQSQVNAMMGKARQEGRASAMKDLFSRYGVNGEDELNDIFGRGQAYDDLNDEFGMQTTSLNDLKAENALLKSSVPQERWEDVKLILGGKGMDVNAENIDMMIGTHPEWRGPITANMGMEGSMGNAQMLTPDDAEAFAAQPKGNISNNQTPPPATLRKLGNESSTQLPTESEEEKVARLFGKL